MSTREELTSVLDQLPEAEIRQLLDYARLLYSKDKNRETQPDAQEPAQPRGEVLALNQQLSDEELAALIAEEEAVWKELDQATGGTPYRFNREDVYADRVPKAYRH